MSRCLINVQSYTHTYIKNERISYRLVFGNEESHIFHFTGFFIISILYVYDKKINNIFSYFSKTNHFFHFNISHTSLFGLGKHHNCLLEM